MFGRRSGRAAPALWRAGWLAPAAAGALLVGVLLNPPLPASLPRMSASEGWAELVLSNQSYAAYLPGSFQRSHNQIESLAGVLRLAAATNAAP